MICTTWHALKYCTRYIYIRIFVVSWILYSSCWSRPPRRTHHRSLQSAWDRWRAGRYLRCCYCLCTHSFLLTCKPRSSSLRTREFESERLACFVWGWLIGGLVWLVGWFWLGDFDWMVVFDWLVDLDWLLGLISVFSDNFGWVGFLVVCFLYKINPNPRKIVCCGKKVTQVPLLA